MKQLEKIQTLTDITIGKYIDSYLKWAFTLPILRDQLIIDSLKEKPNGPFGIQFLRLELYLAFLLALSNVISDSDDRAASICNIIRHAHKPKAKELLRRAFTAPMSKDRIVFVGGFSDKSKDIYVQNKIADYQTEHEDLFDKNFDQVIEAASKLLESKLVKKVRDVRDKTISHYEMRSNDGHMKLVSIEDLGLKWDDGITLYRKTKPIMENLGLYIRSTGYAFDFSEEDQTRLGKSIWSTGAPIA